MFKVSSFSKKLSKVLIFVFKSAQSFTSFVSRDKTPAPSSVFDADIFFASQTDLFDFGFSRVSMCKFSSFITKRQKNKVQKRIYFFAAAKDIFEGDLKNLRGKMF